MVVRCANTRQPQPGGPREGWPDYTWLGNPILFVLNGACQGGPMNVLKPEKKLAVLSALIEGCSIRATSRMTGVHKTTILKVLKETGKRCQSEMDQRLRNIECEAVECDDRRGGSAASHIGK